jgi:predicted Ser/Thr protein kinase
MRRNFEKMPVGNMEKKEANKTSSAFELQEFSPEVAQKMRESIQSTIDDPEKYIDKGGAGTVYKLSAADEGRVCIKILERRESAPDPGHTADIEARFLRIMSNVEVAGVRAPRCFGYWVSEDADWLPGIVMEQLDAVNLQHILNGKEDFPDSFDAEEFFDALEEYIDFMHSRVGILHDDMAPRNVMVDRATGKPRVIDFGRSRFLHRLSEREQVMLQRAELEEVYKIQNQVEAIDKK